MNQHPQWQHGHGGGYSENVTGQTNQQQIPSPGQVKMFDPTKFQGNSTLPQQYYSQGSTAADGPNQGVYAQGQYNDGGLFYQNQEQNEWDQSWNNQWDWSVGQESANGLETDNYNQQQQYGGSYQNPNLHGSDKISQVGQMNQPQGIQNQPPPTSVPGSATGQWNQNFGWGTSAGEVQTSFTQQPAQPWGSSSQGSASQPSTPAQSGPAASWNPQNTEQSWEFGNSQTGWPNFNQTAPQPSGHREGVQVQDQVTNIVQNPQSPSGYEDGTLSSFYNNDDFDGDEQNRSGSLHRPGGDMVNSNVNEMSNQFSDINLLDEQTSEISSTAQQNQTVEKPNVMFNSSNSFSSLEHHPSPFDDLDLNKSQTSGGTQNVSGGMLDVQSSSTGHSRNSSLGGNVQFIIGSDPNSASHTPHDSRGASQNHTPEMNLDDVPSQHVHHEADSHQVTQHPAHLDFNQHQGGHVSASSVHQTPDEGAAQGSDMHDAPTAIFKGIPDNHATTQQYSDPFKMLPGASDYSHNPAYQDLSSPQKVNQQIPPVPSPGQTQPVEQSFHPLQQTAPRSASVQSSQSGTGEEQQRIHGGEPNVPFGNPQSPHMYDQQRHVSYNQQVYRSPSVHSNQSNVTEHPHEANVRQPFSPFMDQQAGPVTSHHASPQQVIRPPSVHSNQSSASEQPQSPLVGNITQPFIPQGSQQSPVFSPHHRSPFRQVYRSPSAQSNQSNLSDHSHQSLKADNITQPFTPHGYQHIGHQKSPFQQVDRSLSNQSSQSGSAMMHPRSPSVHSNQSNPGEQVTGTPHMVPRPGSAQSSESSEIAQYTALANQPNQYASPIYDQQQMKEGFHAEHAQMGEAGNATAHVTSAHISSPPDSSHSYVSPTAQSQNQPLTAPFLGHVNSQDPHTFSSHNISANQVVPPPLMVTSPEQIGHSAEQHGHAVVQSDSSLVSPHMLNIYTSTIQPHAGSPFKPPKKTQGAEGPHNFSQNMMPNVSTPAHGSEGVGTFPKNYPQNLQMPYTAEAVMGSGQFVQPANISSKPHSAEVPSQGQVSSAVGSALPVQSPSSVSKPGQPVSEIPPANQPQQQQQYCSAAIQQQVHLHQWHREANNMSPATTLWKNPEPSKFGVVLAPATPTPISPEGSPVRSVNKNITQPVTPVSNPVPVVPNTRSGFSPVKAIHGVGMGSENVTDTTEKENTSKASVSSEPLNVGSVVNSSFVAPPPPVKDTTFQTAKQELDSGSPFVTNMNQFKPDKNSDMVRQCKTESTENSKPSPQHPPPRQESRYEDSRYTSERQDPGYDRHKNTYSERPSSRGPTERSFYRGPHERPSSRGPPERPSSRGPPERPSSRGPPERSSSRGPPERPSSRGPPERPSSRGPPERPSSRGPPERPSSRGPSERPSSRGPPERPSSRGPPEDDYKRHRGNYPSRSHYEEDYYGRPRSRQGDDYYDRPRSRQGYGYDHYDRPRSRQGYPDDYDGSRSRQGYGYEQYERPRSRQGYGDSQYERPRSRQGYGYEDQPPRPRSRQGEQDQPERSRQGRQIERSRTHSENRPHSRSDYDSYYGNEAYYRSKGRYRARDYDNHYGYGYYDYQRDPYYDPYYGHDPHRERLLRGYYEEMQYYNQHYDSRHQYDDRYRDYYNRQSSGGYEDVDRHSSHSRSSSRGPTPGMDDYEGTGADNFAREFHGQGSRPSSRTDYEQSGVYPMNQYDQSYSHGYDYSAYDYNSEYSHQYQEAPPERRTPVKFSIPHVRVSFGPGGHLVKVVPNRPAEGQPALVEIHDTETLIPPSPETEELKQFPGPLVKGDTHKNDVLAFCHHMVRVCRDDVMLMDRESAELCWKLLELLIKQNGTIVGTDIAELLLDGRVTSTEEYAQKGIRISASTSDLDQSNIDSANLVTTSDRTVINKSSLSVEEITDRFRNLLLYGRKKDALEWAMKNALWGHALFLASKLDNRTHANVMTRFANVSMRMNDPLQTLYQLMSSRQPAAVTCISDERWGDWRPHLAMILSNHSYKPELDRKSIIQLGDTLASRRCLYASHFCYLMAQCNFGVYSKKTSKIVLIGSNHTLQWELFANNKAVQCTEVYEYAQSLGNPLFTLPNFQLYKFIYATRLAQCGMLEQALHYCEVIANTILQYPVQYQPILFKQLYELGNRLKYSDPQLLQTGDDQSDPYWLQQLLHISQRFDDGTLTAQPLSGSGTPMGFGSTATGSEYGDVVTSAAEMTTGQYQATFQGQTTDGQDQTDGHAVDQTQQQAYAADQSQQVYTTDQYNSQYTGQQDAAAYSAYGQDQQQAWTQDQSALYNSAYAGYAQDGSYINYAQPAQDTASQPTDGAVTQQQQQQALEGSTNQAHLPFTHYGADQQQVLSQQQYGTDQQQQLPPPPQKVNANYNINSFQQFAKKLPNSGELGASATSVNSTSTETSGSTEVDSAASPMPFDYYAASAQQAEAGSGLSDTPCTPSSCTPPPLSPPPYSPNDMARRTSVHDVSEVARSRRISSGSNQSKGSSTPKLSPSSPRRNSEQQAFKYPPPPASPRSKQIPPVTKPTQIQPAITSKPEAKPSQETDKSKHSSDKKPKQGSGWLGGLFNKFTFRGKNEMILPDDKNPTITWDPVAGKWKNNDGDEEESKPALPPPKDNELIGPAAATPNAAVTPAGSAPPTGNRFSRPKTRGAHGKYVDVLNPGGLRSSATAPSSLFSIMPNSTPTTQKIFTPTVTGDEGQDPASQTQDNKPAAAEPQTESASQSQQPAQTPLQQPPSQQSNQQQSYQSNQQQTYQPNQQLTSEQQTYQQSQQQTYQQNQQQNYQQYQQQGYQQQNYQQPPSYQTQQSTQQQQQFYNPNQFGAQQNGTQSEQTGQPASVPEEDANNLSRCSSVSSLGWEVQQLTLQTQANKQKSSGEDQSTVVPPAVPQMPVMYDPSQFQTQKQPAAAAPSQQTRGLRYGQRRAYPK